MWLYKGYYCRFIDAFWFFFLQRFINFTKILSEPSNTIIDSSVDFITVSLDMLFRGLFIASIPK